MIDLIKVNYVITVAAIYHVQFWGGLWLNVIKGYQNGSQEV